MRDWLQYKDELSSLLLDHEALPAMPSCGTCGKQPQSKCYRCLDCFTRSIYCKRCCLKDHSKHPFHSIEEWTGTHFQATTLSKMGLVLPFGHGGDRCGKNDEATEDEWEDEDEDEEGGVPGREKGRKLSKLTIVDRAGVFTYWVRWCTCGGVPHYRQLVELGLYPASFKQPKTAFTFRLLKYYHIDLMECRTPPFAFYNKIRRQTHENKPDSVPVSFLHFSISSCLVVLMDVVRTGIGS